MFVKAVSFAALAASALAQTFSVNTPASLVQCQPALISWSGGTGPFILSVIPGGQVSAAALEYLEQSTTSTSFTWNVNLAAATYVTIKLTDSTGANVYSAPLTILEGSTSCMTSSAGSSATDPASSSATDAATTVASSAAASSAAASSSAAPSSSAGVVSSAASKVSSAVESAKSGASSAVSSAAAAATSKSAAKVNGIAIPVVAAAAAAFLL